MTAHDPNQQRSEPDVPVELRQHVEALYAPPPGLVVLPERDLAIRREARARAAAIRRRRIIIRAGGWGSLAAAAGLAMAVVLWGPGSPASGPQSPSAEPLQLAGTGKDINGDGVVDILDALALARAVRTSATIDPAWDYTGDGTVDQRDIDAIAAAAVRLEERG